MGFKDFLQNMSKNIKKKIITVKAQIQTNSHAKKEGTIATVASRVGSELITPSVTATGAPVSVVTGPDYRRAGSTVHVREAELSGIYFNDVLEFELESSLRTQYRNSHVSEFVMVPSTSLKEVLSLMSEEEIKNIVDQGYLVYDEHNRPTMTVEKYRTWQQTREVQVRKVEPVGLDVGIRTIEGMTSASAVTCQGFYLDDSDTLRIAENYGGGTKGVLNKYAQQANIPVPILAVSAIMSVVDKEGNPVPLIDEYGKITKKTYLAVRKALNGDPLVGFLDDFTGYSVDEKGNLKPGRKTTFGNTAIPLEHLHGGLHRILGAATEGFKISPEGYGTSYAFRANATKVDSQCDKWISDAISEFESHPELADRSLIDLVALDEAAIGFARDVIREDSQVKYINRRQKNLLRTVLNNQTDHFKAILSEKTTKYKGIFEELTGDFAGARGVVGNSSHKFVEPKPFDEGRYTADYAMLKDNILLVNAVQLGLSSRLENIAEMEFEDQAAADTYIAETLKLDSKTITDLAAKYGFDLTTASTPKEFVEKVLELQTRDQIAQIIAFNQSVIDLVELKEDLRVCEHTMGQVKFKNLTTVEDLHKKALERINEQQKLIIKNHQDKIDAANREIKRIKEAKAAAVKQVKSLQTKIDGKIQEQEGIARQIIGGEPFFAVITREIERVNGRNGKGFNTSNPSFRKLLDSNMAKILKNLPISETGEIDQDALTTAVSSVVADVLNANQARAEGLNPGQKPRMAVTPETVQRVTSSIIGGIMADPANLTLQVNAGEIQTLITERDGVQAQIDGAEGVVSFDDQITAQEEIVTTNEKAIKGIKHTPEEQKQIVNAEKQYRADLAVVKGEEFKQVITTLTEMVTSHTERMDALIKKGVFEIDENGKLVVPEGSIIRTLANTNNPQILDDFTKGLESYGDDCSQLLETLSGRIKEIVDVAFKEYDLIIELGEDGKGVKSMKHIDNPTRVKGDIDPRIAGLYEHQSQIDVYREIMDETTSPERRAALVAKLPPKERVALGITPEGNLPEDETKKTQMTTFLNGRIEEELQASDKVRLAYAEMSPEEKIKFQRDYVRYEHYQTRRYIDASKVRTEFSPEVTTELVDDGAALDALFADPTLAAEAESADIKFAEMSYKERSKPRVKGSSVVVEEDLDDVEEEEIFETPSGRERVYEDEAVVYQQAFDNRAFIAHIQNPGMSNETRLATIQAYSELFPEKAEFYSSLIGEDGSISGEVEEIATGLETTMATIAETKGELTDSKCTTFIGEVVGKHFAELDEQGIDYTPEDVAAYKNEIENSIAKQQQQEEDKKKGKTPKKIEYTTKGCDLATKALKGRIKAIQSNISTIDSNAAEIAKKQEIYERGLLEKGFLELVAKTTKPALEGLSPTQIMEIVSKGNATFEGETIAKWRTCGTDEEVLQFIETELGITPDQVEVITARQLQTIADPSVVINESGQIINASGVNVPEALYTRIDNASTAELSDTVTVRDAVLYAALHGVADRVTTQAQIDTMLKLFKDNGIEITPENVSKFVSGELTIKTPSADSTTEVAVPMNATIEASIKEKLAKNGLTPSAPTAGDTGMGTV